MVRLSVLSVLAVLTMLAPSSAVTCRDGPLKIFLLDGQSNMVGMGSLEHLKILLDDPDTHDEYEHLWNDTAQDWKERSDVYIKFDEQVGKLKAGLGAAGSSRGGHIGPELEFGWFLGDHPLCSCSKQPILLLKAAYGGRDLAIDFRPPLAGIGNYSGVKPIHYGWEYREMIESIQNTLDNDLPNIIPTYNASVGYELSGFVWFQGWNDMLDWQKVNEYETNLANLVRSVRLDLEAPKMPVVIGELGMHGLNYTGRGSERVMAMRAAERRVAESAEFRDSALFVPTAKYVVENGTSYNGNYHYYGRADTYCHIGRAFGKAMLQLLNANTMTEDKQTSDLRQFSLRGVLDDAYARD